MIEAVAGAFVLVFAQFGQFGFSGLNTKEIEVLQIVRHPKWEQQDYYVPPVVEASKFWIPINCPL